MGHGMLEAMMMGALSAPVAAPQEIMPSLLDSICEETKVRRDTKESDYALYLELEGQLNAPKLREQVYFQWQEMRDQAINYTNAWNARSYWVTAEQERAAVLGYANDRICGWGVKNCPQCFK